MSLKHHVFTEAPGNKPSPTFDAAEWRYEWFVHAGTVARHYGTAELWLFYCPGRADKSAIRQRLLDQLAAEPGNVNAVLAECDAAHDRFERRFLAEATGDEVII